MIIISNFIIPYKQLNIITKIWRKKNKNNTTTETCPVIKEEIMNYNKLKAISDMTNVKLFLTYLIYWVRNKMLLFIKHKRKMQKI